MPPIPARLAFALTLLGACPVAEPGDPEPSPAVEAPITGVFMIRHRMATGTENESLIVHGVQGDVAWARSTLDPVAALALAGQMDDLPDGAFSIDGLGFSAALAPRTEVPADLGTREGRESLLVGDRWQAYQEPLDGGGFVYRSSSEDDAGWDESLGALDLPLSWGGETPTSLGSVPLPVPPELQGLDPMGSLLLDDLAALRWTPSEDPGDRVVIELRDANRSIALSVWDDDGVAFMSHTDLDQLGGVLLQLSVARVLETSLPDGGGMLLVRTVADTRFEVRNVRAAQRGLGHGQDTTAWLPTEPTTVLAGSSGTLRIMSREAHFPEGGVVVQGPEGIEIGESSVEPGGAVLRVAYNVDDGFQPGDAVITAVVEHTTWVARVGVAGHLSERDQCEGALVSNSLDDGDWIATPTVAGAPWTLPCGPSGPMEGPIRWVRIHLGAGEGVGLDAWSRGGSAVGLAAWDGCGGEELGCGLEEGFGLTTIQLDAGLERDVIVAVALQEALPGDIVEISVLRWLDADLRLTPARVLAGTTTSLVLESPWMDLANGQPVVDLGDGITVLGSVLDASASLLIDIEVGAAAAPGPRDVTVTTEDGPTVAPAALAVDGVLTLSTSCVAADLAGPITLAGWVGSTASLNNLQGSEPGCTIAATDGPDGFVRLPDPVPGLGLRITLESEFDGSMVLIPGCAAPAESCADDAGDGDVETLFLPPETWETGPWWLRIDGRNAGSFRLDLLAVAP